MLAQIHPANILNVLRNIGNQIYATDLTFVVELLKLIHV